MPTLASEVTSALRDILGDRKRSELVASRLGLSGRRPTLAQMGDELGVSRERARQVVRDALDEFLRRRPVLRSLDSIELGVFENSPHSRPIPDISAEHGLASAGNEKWGLIWLARSYGYKRLADELVQHGAVAFEKKFLIELRKLVRHRGAIGLGRLLSELDDAGWETTRDQLIAASKVVNGLKFADGVLVATANDGVVVTALQKALSVTTPIHLLALLNAVVRVQQSRSSSSLMSFEELAAFLQNGPSLAEDLGDGWYRSLEQKTAEEVLEGMELEILEVIETTEKGLISRGGLVDALVGRGYSVHSATQYMSYSAIVDFACSGVFRLRGRSFNAGAAEKIRRSFSSRSGWTPWGWAGVDAIWLITSASDGRGRLRLPAEIANLMAEKYFEGSFADGTIVGKIKVGSDLEFDLPDFLGTGRVALEVKLFPEPQMVLIPLGDSHDSAEAYPGDVDGCVLRNGGWQFVVEVCESMLGGDRVLVPSALLRKWGFEIGDTVNIHGARGQLTLEFLPHAGHIRPLDGELESLGAAEGDRVTVGIDKDNLRLKYIGSTNQQRGTTEDLLIRLGVPPAEATGNVWAVMGSALGFSGARDRLSIADLLRRRERPDLARLAVDSREARVEKAVSENWFHSGHLVSDPTQLAFKASDGVLHVAVGLGQSGGGNIPPGAIKGPLGLLWSRRDQATANPGGPGSVALDKEWVRWARAFVMVLGAAHDAPITLSTDGVMWAVDRLQYTELIDALEAIASSQPVTGPLFSGADEFFPPSAFAFRRLAREACQAGLRELEFSADGIVAIAADGRRSNPCSPREALLFRPD
jgi:hypothetical protein